MIRALIVDDEKPAQDVMQKMIAKFVPGVEVVGVCSNVPDAVLRIGELKPDVVFLDIEMPKYTGFELLSFFNEIDFEIIFVTAYSEYALKAFEVSAVDYVLKPVQIEHLRKSVERLKERLDVQSMKARLDALKENIREQKLQKLVIPMSDGLKYIRLNEISHINANGSYSELCMQNGEKIMTSKNLRHYEKTFAQNEDFIRVHRSYIINVQCVSALHKSKNEITMEYGTILAVSREMKSTLEAKLSGLAL